MANKPSPTLRQWSTPLTIGTYLFTGVSGALLFFHLGEDLLKEAHEWIGLAFVLGALLHIRSNWMPFRRYFSSALPKAVMAAALVASATLMASSGGDSGKSPVRAVMHSIEKAPLSLVAQLQERDENELLAVLQREGVEVNDPADSLQTIATANQRSSRELLPLLFLDGANGTLSANH